MEKEHMIGAYSKEEEAADGATFNPDPLAIEELSEEHFQYEKWEELSLEKKKELKPSKEEKKVIRKSYNIGGASMLASLVLTVLVSDLITFGAVLLLNMKNGISFGAFLSGESTNVGSYIGRSAISPAITLLTFLTVNLLVFFVGIKISGIRFNSLFETKNYRFKNLVQYFFIGCFFQTGTGYVVSLITQLMPGADIQGAADELFSFSSDKAVAISLLYVCVIAPLTEELLYRGLVMRLFSGVSTRFGIIMSALFFALSHGNIAQFCLTFIIGLFMGYIDVKHNSLAPSIVVHFSNNLIGSGASLISEYFSGTEQERYIAPVFNLSMLALAVAGLIVFILFCRKNTFPKATVAQQMRCRNIAMTSVPTMIAIVLYVLMLLNNTFG